MGDIEELEYDVEDLEKKIERLTKEKGLLMCQAIDLKAIVLKMAHIINGGKQ